MAWIELHDTLPDHDKVLELSEALKMDKDMVVGKLVRFWTWALNNREDGFFKARDVATIAEVMRFAKKPQTLVNALVNARLLDATPDGYYIHDWDERVGMLISKREKIRSQARDRKKKQRLKERNVTPDFEQGHANVTRDVTHDIKQCHAVTKTVPKPYVSQSLSVSQSVSLSTDCAPDGLTDGLTIGDAETQIEADILREVYDPALVDAIVLEVFTGLCSPDREYAEICRQLGYANIEHVILAIQNAGEIQNPSGYIRACLRNSLLDVAANNQF